MGVRVIYTEGKKKKKNKENEILLLKHIEVSGT